MSATFALTFCAAATALSISAPGETPTLAPSFLSAHAPIKANSHPLKPTRLMSLKLGFCLVLLSSAINRFLSSSMATMSGFVSRMIFSTFLMLSGAMCDVPIILSFATVFSCVLLYINPLYHNL